MSLVNDLTEEQLCVPQLPIINPFLWELGHIAWFQEKWVLRHQGGADGGGAKPIWPGADALYDSANVPHASRWQLVLPPLASTLDYLNAVLQRVLHAEQGPPADDYFLRLVLYHEDMHGEAFAYMRQTLGYPTPRAGMVPAQEKCDLRAGDVSIPGGTFQLGAAADEPFVFDNEKWAHPVRVGPFRMARAPVTNAEFAAFVDAGGYEQPACWNKVGWDWRQRARAAHPVYWRRGPSGAWQQRQFERWLPLAEDEPVIFVNWHEADAFCRWAGRRLPTEAEWEYAASMVVPGNGALTSKRRYPWGDEPPSAAHANLDLRRTWCLPVHACPASDNAWGVRQMLGNVWEWTASDFAPYPGFAADPYKEYSAPWFGGTHKVLRGGSFATRSRIACNLYRNYFTPDRRDVPAGFRTCAL